ncbi:MAG: PH domain-containing protein, partial [Promethearchaeota archaeon]
MPIYKNESCPICGKNPNLTYICEDCHEIFCEDCVDLNGEDNLVCVQCGDADIHSDKHGRPFCRKCGSHNMRNIKKLNPTCRICESENVVLIEEKQKQLIEEFKTIIKDTRAFIRPLEGMVERLTLYRHNLYQLRTEYPPCFHYSTLEDDAILNFKLFDKAKSTLYEHVNRFFQEIQHNINYIAEIQVTHPSNLPYISEILKHFERERKKVTNLSINNVEVIDKRISPDEEKVEFMGAMQGIFTSFIGKLQLERNEKVVFALKCKLSTGISKKKDYSNKNGTILITSKRLYFYHEQGVFQKRTVELFSVKLSDLQQAGVKGRLKKKVSLEFLNSMYKFSISKDNREELINWIEKARRFDTSNKNNENNSKNLAKYKLNTKLFREDLENTIYELIGYHGSYVDNPISNSNNQVIHSSMYRRKGLNGHRSNTYQNQIQDSRFKPMNFQNLSQKQEPIIDRNRYESFSKSFEDHTENVMTPAGHYGYPHDHTASFKTKNFNQKVHNPVRNSNSYQSNEYSSQNIQSVQGPQNNFG